jgi:hypothetical protein
VGGLLVLAGHFQAALYAFSAVGVLVVAISVLRRGDAARKAFGFLLIVAAGSVLLSAIQTLPGLELAARSIRASANYSVSTEGVMDPRALVTLALPDFLGALWGSYHGPSDVTQYYFYSGFLLLPLALLGLRNSTIRPYALWLAIPALLYMAGPALGVFRLIALLPGFRSVRACPCVVCCGHGADDASSGGRRLAGIALALGWRRRRCGFGGGPVQH